MLLEPFGELRVDRRLDERTDRGVAELRLRLSLELRIAELHRDDRDQSLANVLADQVLLLLFEQALAPRVPVEHVRERLLQALFVHAPFVRVDRVRERMERLRVRVVPLQSDLDFRGPVALLRLEVRDTVQRIAALREVLHEVDETPGGLEDFLRSGPLVDELDLDALVEERELLQPVREDLTLELHSLGEDLGVRPEADQGPGLGAALALGELLRDLAPTEGHRVRGTVSLDLGLELLGERVHHRDADAAGDLVALAAELAAGVQHGEHDLEGGAAILATGDRLDRDASAVVEHARRAVRVERHDDLVAVPGHGFVDRVVDDLVHEVMQPP